MMTEYLIFVGFIYRQRYIIILIKNGTILIKAQPAIPQSPSTQKIRGAVIETKTGMPLPGVTVVAEIEGKPLTGTATDADGHFEITLPSNIGELTFTCVGS